ncbi:class A beta-lactamase [Allosaccharopolyspora coralli]|uniref:class A beta-lactamase n=1 Tax=Allosaccharopolyspora coralli TaxID=2665642 RepID=UPI001E54077A|nr:class A beta-lactamase [Allosaccharopolyspora coralli]
MKSISRRGVLAGLAAVPVLASTRHAIAGSEPTFPELEQRYGARLGVWARNAVTGRTVHHRPHERFAMTSTFKPYAAAALLREHGLAGDYFRHRVFFRREDLVVHSPICEQAVDTGMTVLELCDAAITYSDNTAGNLLLTELGGPAAIAPFARTLGDPATRLDRWEPELNEAERGDPRDTTTPAAIGTGYGRLVLADGLPRPERDRLTAWLLANTTGDTSIRAGVPPTWVTGDKTGGGSYATNNDVAVTWTDLDQPIIIAVLSDKPIRDAEPDDALIADAAKRVAERLTDA